MTKEFLRGLTLFANLSDSDLDWLSEQAEPVTIEASTYVVEEGQMGDAAYIVMDGEFEVVKKADVQNIMVAIREAGAVIGEMALLDHAPRMASVRAVRTSRVLRIRADTFEQLISRSPSAALAIMQTVSKRLRQNEALLRQSEKMAALGTLAAGLAHELNNPAAAVRSSANQLRSAVTSWSEATGELERMSKTNQQITTVGNLKTQIEKEHTPNTDLDPLARSDQENEMQNWMEERGIQDAWELAPAFVSAGWNVGWLTTLGDTFKPPLLSAVLKWLATGHAVYSLLDEISMGTERVSEIVKAVKAYSYLDQAPVQQVDIHEGLDNTLVILRHKLSSGIRVTREYAADLPRIEAYGSELNQVWTNILDNAVYAMGGKGELILRTYTKDKNVVVEIQDNGPGIPPEIQKRIFEPFFTTKPPGQGTGLGLHIAYTIINNHYGRMNVTSEIGRTCFQITLPIQLPRS